ncbi:MAG: hypothetical protein JSU72_01135 [Deltaproteobacteria bacterium]|nr:MAG: hypothetical protein JSU72_01135 [Deltaproteobacteria bacterium]
MKTFFKLSCSFAIIGLFFSTSCTSTSTKMSSVWKDNKYTGGFIDNVMVVGRSDKFERRKMFEETFVKRFEKHGVRAVSSVAATSPNRELSKEIIIAKAEKLEIDTVLVTHLISVNKEEEYHPPSTTAAPNRYFRFDTYSYSSGDYSKYGGTYSEKKHVKLESNLYELATEKLIWSAKSETIDPKSVSDVFDSLCVTIMKNLRENKLLR